MRTIVLFCLTLCFLLFKGNDNVYASHLSAAKIGVQFETYTKPAHTRFHKNHNLHTQKENPPGETTYVEGTQDEDDSIKIAIVNIKQISTFCYISLLVDKPIYQKFALPYCEHISYTSSFKYLLLGVFRI